MGSGLDAAIVDSVSLVAPGILRVRVPVPFPPSEVNVWLLSGSDGWAVIDAGVDSPSTRALFERVLADPHLEGARVSRLLLTHHHPDHVGLAGWLHQRTGAEVEMSRLEWLQARVLMCEDPAQALSQLLAHNSRCGAASPSQEFLKRRGMLFPKWVGALPNQYLRLREGDELALAGTVWRVMIGEGHAPEMICLYSQERSMLIAADQILERISPHIGSSPSDPLANPLAAFLSSLKKFEALPEDTLVLPSHGEPFKGLHARTGELRAHHGKQLDRLLDFCTEPRTVMDTLPILFRPLPVEQISFGLSEALSHLRYLVSRRELEQEDDKAQWVFLRR